MHYLLTLNNDKIERQSTVVMLNSLNLTKTYRVMKCVFCYICYKAALVMRSLKFIFIFFGIFGHAQENDSIRSLSYADLDKIILTDISRKPEEKRKYAEVYLQKALQENDSLLIGKGYYLFARTEKRYTKHAPFNRISFYDSAIQYTEKLKDPVFPAVAYLEKGSVLHVQRKYAAALDNYLLAENKLENKKNDTYYSIKFNIGFIHRIIGNHEEALKAFKQCLKYQEKIKHSDDERRYYNMQNHISKTYPYIGKYDEATRINQEGIRYALQRNLVNYYAKFLNNQGANLMFQGKYQEAIDSLEKALPNLPERHKSLNQFYLGKSYMAINKKAKALNYFKKVDTAFVKSSTLMLQSRDAYKFLIQDSKQKQDKVSELYYTKQLLKLDSIHHIQFRNLYKTIINEYDIPNLVKSKDKKINSILLISILLSLLLLVGFLYYYRLKRVYKKRYDAIVSKNKENNASIEVVKDVKPKNIVALTIGLDDETIQTILKGLEVFEEEKHYLTNQISLQDAAKIIKTNSKYLSKIINSHKGKTFINYINDLRIDYLVDRIQNDGMYKKYTIKAIAQEGGFINSGTFFKAFQKRTGLKPSYFIKKVREEQGN